MNSLSKLGLAAAIALGMGGAAISQDAGVGADVNAGGNLQVKPGAMGADANANLGVDAMTTGSINNHGNLVSSIQTTQDFDLSAYSASSTIDCVKVSTLQGDAQGNAQAIGNAASGNQAITTLHTDLQANADLMADLEAACQVADFDINDVVFFETGADGKLVFYYDDSAA